MRDISRSAIGNRASALLCTALLLFAETLPAAGDELPPKVARLVEQGDDLLAAGELLRATRRFERANRAAKGGSLEVALRLIEAYHATDLFQKAVDVAVESRGLVDTPAEEAELALLTGRLYLESAYLLSPIGPSQRMSEGFVQRLDTALVFFAHAGQVSPETVPEVFYLLGRINEVLDREAPEPYYGEYLRRQPDGEYADLARIHLQFLEGEHPNPDEVGSDMSPPVKINAPTPQYTEEARRARVRGVVVVSAIIDEQGETVAVEVIKGLPYGLDEAARRTIEEWTFEPARVAGRPVPVSYTLTVSFELQYP